MLEAEVKFKQEDREGLVAVGTYLIDAARRFGIHFDGPCDLATETHYCTVAIDSGSDLLSPKTKAETKYLKENERGPNERLACQVKIERAGEIEVMTEKKAEEPAADAAGEAVDGSEAYKKAFAEMPLEKKIANLVQLETIALGETVSFIINSPFKVADKLMDVMAEFGFKKEERQKESARPEEHKSAKTNSTSKEKANSNSKDQKKPDTPE